MVFWCLVSSASLVGFVDNLIFSLDYGNVFLTIQMILMAAVQPCASGLLCKQEHNVFLTLAA